MAVRGVYSGEEKKMLEEWERDADTRQGWAKPGGMGAMWTSAPNKVTTESLIRYGAEKDRYNPFWSSEEYAIGSRWGGLIGAPWFLENLKPDERMMNTPKSLFRTFYLMGHDIETYQPIRPGDVIRTWQKRPVLEDSTDPSGKGPRKFRYIDGHCDWINQRDEIIGKFTQYVEVTLWETERPQDKFLDDYGYTQKELDYIAELTEAERPRGGNTLYWEDVKVGDNPQTIVNGPTDFTHLSFGGPPATPPNSFQPRKFERYVAPTGGPVMFGYIPGKDGLLYPTHGGRHNNNRAAQWEGGPQAWLFNFEPRYQMTRLVTNYIGDDGFVCKLGWRHQFRTPVGDTIIARAEITKKYVENGEHLIDLRIWCTDLRGTITDMALATAKLVTKGDYSTIYKKIMKR
jgi:hypothetical protein